MTTQWTFLPRRRRSVIDALVDDLANIILPALDADPETFRLLIKRSHNERVMSIWSGLPNRVPYPTEYLIDTKENDSPDPDAGTNN